MLNQVMDTRFEPVHRTWKTLWSSQVRAERELSKQKAARDGADAALQSVCEEILTTLDTGPDTSRSRLQHDFPASVLAGHGPARPVRAPELSPFLRTLSEAPEDLLPSPLKARFRQRFHHAMDVRARFESARNSALEARSERAAADESWDEAYKVYHHTVEFVARSDPGRIRRWILAWPPD